MKTELNYAQDLIEFINQSPTAFQAVANLKAKLEQHSFQKYEINQQKPLKPGDRYYYSKNDSALIAFEIGERSLQEGFRIFGAHTDSPSLRIKPHAVSVKENTIRLNTEVYGGAIYNTWFDRPLSLAGRVMIQGETPGSRASKLLDFRRPLLILPNVAIHMNHSVNKENEINPYLHLLPVLAMTEEKELPENYFQTLIAKELKISADKILDFDLFTYDVSPGTIVGLNQDFILSARLDNLSMCYAGVNALANLDPGRSFNGINVLIFTDNEEVGSLSKQGAKSLFIRDVLESICLNLKASRQDFLAMFDHSIMISADEAHAVHPNYSEYADPDHRPKINRGPVIKLAASQAYASDSYSASYFVDLCKRADVPYQWFVNRSDLRGGSTIGSISSALLPMPTVDIGNAIWAMHSSRETGGVKDLLYLDQVLRLYFNL